jgi:hypothetical protein
MKGSGKKTGTAPAPAKKSFGAKTEYAPTAKTSIKTGKGKA